MFQLDKSTLEYLKDLSDPDVQSSSDMESIELKRDIIKTNFLTLFVVLFVVSSIIILFIFYLPGLYNVTQIVLSMYLGILISYWYLILIAIFFLVLLSYFLMRS